MPYKSKEDKRRNAREYFQRKRRELVMALGGKCVVCENDNYPDLEIHHIVPFDKRSRSFVEYFNPSGKEIRCRVDHEHTESWRRKRRRR